MQCILLYHESLMKLSTSCITSLLFVALACARSPWYVKPNKGHGHYSEATSNPSCFDCQRSVLICFMHRNKANLCDSLFSVEYKIQSPNSVLDRVLLRVG